MSPVGALSEKQFQQAVIDLARAVGWRVFHAFDSRRSEPGFPDLVAVRSRHVLFAELKTEKGRLRSAQQEWLEALRGAAEGLDSLSVCLWRPSDWPEIERVLNGASRQVDG